nr:kinesin-like protein KIN-14C [Tanacetum cinerariifolium]
FLLERFLTSFLRRVDKDLGVILEWFLPWASLDSHDETFKQREAAVKEVGILKGELQQVREDKERQLLLETCSSQREQISLLQYQSAAANQKLKASMLEIYNENIYASSRHIVSSFSNDSLNSVGRTDMNEESSRSHAVFILRIHGVNE